MGGMTFKAMGDLVFVAWAIWQSRRPNQEVCKIALPGTGEKVTRGTRKIPLGDKTKKEWASREEESDERWATKR